VESEGLRTCERCRREKALVEMYPDKVSPSRYVCRRCWPKTLSDRLKRQLLVMGKPRERRDEVG